MHGGDGMEWLKHLSLAIDYIEDNLEGEISYDKAAQIACCSTYYFQRMFSYVAGISLSEYIRRRRMTQAAFELQGSEEKIIDIGSKYGYISPPSFNRAFQAVHGVSPTLARMEGTVLKAYPRIRFSINITGGESMRYRIEAKEPIRIVGTRVALQEDQELNFQIVPRFWDAAYRSNMVTKVGQLANQNPQGILGVTVYQNPGEIYYYIAASTDKNDPENMVEYAIPAATWVIFACKGPYPDSIQTVFKRFLTEWLPFSGYEYAGLPDIEVYPINGHTVSNHKLQSGYSEVWIAIKNERG